MTRPEDASERFFRSLPADARRRLELVVSPLLRIRATGTAVDLGDAAGLIFTSSRAVPFAGPPRPLPVFCVGQATTARARHEGWQVRLCAPNADALVAALAAQAPPGPLLHVAGRHRRGQIAQRLSAQGLQTRESVVYDQEELALNAEAMRALAGPLPVIAPLFSPRSAAIFAAGHPGSGRLVLAAISAAALHPAQHLRAAGKFVAKTPDAEGMRHAVQQALRRVEAADSPL